MKTVYVIAVKLSHAQQAYYDHARGIWRTWFDDTVTRFENETDAWMLITQLQMPSYTRPCKMNVDG